MSIYKKTKSPDKIIGKQEKLIETTVTIERSNNKWITPTELKKLYEKVEKVIHNKYPTAKIMIRGLSPKQYYTLKTYDEDELNLKDFDDYLIGKVKDHKDDKFSKFNQIKISILRKNK